MAGGMTKAQEMYRLLGEHVKDGVLRDCSTEYSVLPTNWWDREYCSIRYLKEKLDEACEARDIASILVLSGAIDLLTKLERE